MEIMLDEKEVALIGEGLKVLIENAESARKFMAGEDIDEDNIDGYIQRVSDLYDKVYKKHGETIVHNIKNSIDFPLGHEILCTLKNGEEITLIVTESTDQYMRLECKDVFGCMYINKDQTTTGGIAKSDLQNYLNTVFLQLLPDDLQTAISVTTRIYMDGRNENIKLRCSFRRFRRFLDQKNATYMNS